MQFKPAAGTAWHARKTFRRLSCPSRANSKLRCLFADPSPSSRKNTQQGHSWDTSSFPGTVPPCGIMPLLRRVTLSAFVISLAGNLTRKRNDDIAFSIAVRIDPIDSHSSHLYFFSLFINYLFHLFYLLWKHCCIRTPNYRVYCRSLDNF